MNRFLNPVFAAVALFVFAALPAQYTAPYPTSDVAQQISDAFSDIQVEAKSALALDLLTEEIIFEKNPSKPLPLASLTKIISSLVVVDHIDLNKYIEISKSALSAPEPSTLRAGEHIRAEDLLAFAMGESSNDAMMALVEKFGDEKWFLELMNQKAMELGATTMSFLNATGLDIKLSLGQSLTQTEFGSNFGSAYDLAQIIKNSLDSIIWQIGEKEEVVGKEGIAHKIKHTNILREELAGIYGAKTGFTDNAGGNLVLIVERPLLKPKLIIILGSTIEGRFEDAKKILSMLH